MKSNFLMIIDGTSLLNRCYYADSNIRYSPQGVPINGIDGFLNYVLSILKNQKPSHIAFCFDTGSRDTFRKVLYEGYKLKRKPIPSNLLSQYAVIENILSNMGFPVFVSDRNAPAELTWEGDDYCGTIASMMSDKIQEIVLVSKDQDYLQLIKSEYINNINYETNVWLNTNKAGEYFRECGIYSLDRRIMPNTFIFSRDTHIKVTGLTPEQVIHYKALVGDTSDSIPGVPGIGEKTGSILLSKYKTIENLYEVLEKSSESEIEALVTMWESELGLKRCKSIIKKLLSGKNMAFLSKTLSTIKKDIPLDIELDDLSCNFNATKWNNEVKKIGLHGLVV